MYDLIVIGGGPAGSAAAITAVRSGARVLLLERGRFPRHKVCGEFVSAESLSLLASLLDEARAGLLSNAVRIHRARLIADDRELHVPVDPPAASIARCELDDALWQSAQQSGVETRQQVTVQTVRGTGPFVVTSTSGEYEARSVINSSGRWSNLHSAPSPLGAKWLGVKAHFAEPQPVASVDLYFFAGGYCGVQPVNPNAGRGGRVNACAMVRADVANTLPDVFAQHPALKERSAHWRKLSDPVSTSVLNSPSMSRHPIPLTAAEASGRLSLRWPAWLAWAA